MFYAKFVKFLEGDNNGMTTMMYQNFSHQQAQQMQMKQQGFVPSLNGIMGTGSAAASNNSFMDSQLMQHQQFMLQQQQRNQNFMVNCNPQASPSFMSQSQMQQQQANGPMAVSSPSITSSVDFMAPNSNNGVNTSNNSGAGGVPSQNNFQQTSVANGPSNFPLAASPMSNGMSPMKNSSGLPFSPLSNGFNQQQLLEQQQRFVYIFFITLQLKKKSFMLKNDFDYKFFFF